jgi:hypothetical protein
MCFENVLQWKSHWWPHLTVGQVTLAGLATNVRNLLSSAMLQGCYRFDHSGDSALCSFCCALNDRLESQT